MLLLFMKQRNDYFTIKQSKFIKEKERERSEQNEYKIGITLINSAVKRTEKRKKVNVVNQ